MLLMMSTLIALFCCIVCVASHGGCDVGVVSSTVVGIAMTVVGVDIGVWLCCRCCCYCD